MVSKFNSPHSSKVSFNTMALKDDFLILFTLRQFFVECFLLADCCAHVMTAVVGRLLC